MFTPETNPCPDTVMVCFYGSEGYTDLRQLPVRSNNPEVNRVNKHGTRNPVNPHQKGRPNHGWSLRARTVAAQ